MNHRFLLILTFGLLLAACRNDAPEAPPADDTVRSYLEGRLTINPAVDSVADYRGFEVLVLYREEAQDADTLGYAVTDSTGAFAMDVTAPDRGVYPLIISRRGQVMRQGEIVVAEGDSGRMQLVFPLGSRPFNIRSQENGAWMAYRNARAHYNTALARLVQSENYDAAQMHNLVEQTAALLWNLRETFPNTVGSDVAEAEAVALLNGWNDSLAVAWAKQIDPDSPSYVEIARVARQATARLQGQEAALLLLREFQSHAVSDADKAGIQTEVVIAHLDSLHPSQALAAAETLTTRYPETVWSDWAERASYELENLQPGQPAPVFSAQTADRTAFSLADLRGKIVLLEFYAPATQVYQRDVEARHALMDEFGDALRVVSYSLNPDSLINEAFLDGQALQGIHLFAPSDEGYEAEIPRLYNVNTLPTRYLIDQNGNIAGKYIGGGTMDILHGDVRALTQTP